MADHTDGMNIHLAHRDVTFVAISRARSRRSNAFARAWAGSSSGCPRMASDFNHDFHVSFTPEERAQGKGEVYYNYGMTNFPAEEAPGISLFTRTTRRRSSIPTRLTAAVSK